MELTKEVKLTEATISAIKSDIRLRNMLALAVNKTERTISRWLESNDPMLTTKTALSLIARELGKPESQLLTN